MLVFGNIDNRHFNHLFVKNLESKILTKISSEILAKFPLFEELRASELFPIYAIGNKVNPIMPTAMFRALILFLCSA